MQRSYIRTDTIAIVVYDPEMDEFVFLHEKQGGSFAKLVSSFRSLAFMLRQAFPEGFRGGTELGKALFCRHILCSITYSGGSNFVLSSNSRSYRIQIL